MRIFIEILVALLLVYIVVSLAHFVSTKYGEYLSEMECMNDKVALGLERKHIATGNGTCWHEIKD